jgi:hypothetical protein
MMMGGVSTRKVGHFKTTNTVLSKKNLQTPKLSKFKKNEQSKEKLCLTKKNELIEKIDSLHLLTHPLS